MAYLSLYLSLSPSPGGFGFVEFENAQDAEDAVKALDGTVINGGAIRTGISLVIKTPCNTVRAGSYYLHLPFSGFWLPIDDRK